MTPPKFTQNLSGFGLLSQTRLIGIQRLHPNFKFHSKREVQQSK